jgi:TolB-like protein
MSFWGELKRRNVVKVALAYLVASWLIVQVIGVLTNPLSLPETLDTVVVVLLAIGFPFALIIAWIYEVTPEGIKVTGPADASARAQHPSGARLTYVIVALLVTAVALMALQRFAPTPSREGLGAGSRLAVLPCDDLSPDPSASFFAVGIHEELLHRLVALHGLEIISRTSVLQYAARRPSIPQIAQELDVDAIVECSARYAGDRVQLTVQLIDGASDAHLWSQTYPASMSDVSSLFEIQADIAMQVANALRIEFFEDERAQIEQTPTQSPEAYELYLAALNAMAMFNWESALALLDQALTLDDQFVDAWIAKSQVHSVFAGFRPGVEADAERTAAIEASEIAVRLDAESGRAQASLSLSLGQDGDWIGSELAARRAVALGATPDNAMVKIAVADFKSAVALLEQNLRVDPMNHYSAGLLLGAYNALGDQAARRRHWERGEQLFDYWFGWELEPVMRLGDDDREFLRARAPDLPAWRIGIANFDSPAEGIAAIQAFTEANPAVRSATALRYWSAWAAYFGEPKLSLQWLREATELQATSVMTSWAPLYKDVRREPGFKDLLRDFGVVEYWERFGWPDICRRIDANDFECN